MFVGICPGDEEKEQGKPFVGSSGKYFRSVCSDIGIDLDTEAYLTNLLRCPATEVDVKHTRICGKKLIDEIRQVDPKFIVLMGEPPAKYFLNKPLSKCRGLFVEKGDRKFFVTFNPAYLSRKKKGTEQDQTIFQQDLRRVHAALYGVHREREGIEKVLCKTIEDVLAQMDELIAVDKFTFDIETYAPGKMKHKGALDPWVEGFKVTCISFGYFKGEIKKAFCIPLEHKDNEMNLDELVELLKAFFENSDQGIIGQNIKWDMKCLDIHWGFKFNKIYFDTLPAHALLVGKRAKGTHSLERMSMDYLNVEPYKDILKMEKEFQVVAIEELSDMNMDDCINTLELSVLFEERLKKDNMWVYYNRLITPIIKPLEKIEAKGMLVDWDYIIKLEADMAKQISEGEEKLRSYPELVGKSLSPNSNVDLNTILFDVFKFEPPERKTTLGYAVDKEVIEVLQKKHEHPFLNDLLEWKSQMKLHSTYVMPYLRRKKSQKEWDELGTGYIKRDGRVHSEFNQHVAITGRLSSENPNLQNIPMKIGPIIMRMFIAPEGWKLVVADYNQMELRVLAAKSGDPKMIETFKNDEDIHAMTASEIFGVSKDAISPRQRREAKDVNFGIVYGITSKGLSKKLGCSEDHAQEVIDAYLNRFLGVREYMKDMIRMWNKKGYVETMFGRRVYITGKDKSGCERRAVNAPIQGTAADINELALKAMFDFLEENELRTFSNNVIHDSIVFESPDEEVEITKAVSKELMESIDLDFMGDVKLKADVGVGINFAEAK